VLSAMTTTILTVTSTTLSGSVRALPERCTLSSNDFTLKSASTIFNISADSVLLIVCALQCIHHEAPGGP
jgi:hypothetical protein